MHLNRFDMNLLIALDALLREKSVTRAGERIYLSQSAMSGALQRLRDHFGDELLVRVGRELELTPRAEALVEPIRDILLRVQAALEEPSFEPATAMRTFSIMMSDYCFVAYMRAVIKRLQTRRRASLVVSSGLMPPASGAWRRATCTSAYFPRPRI